MRHETFHYASLPDVREKAEEMGLLLPLSENLSILGQPLTVDGHRIANRLAIQPMEGCDGTPDGAPDTLTRRRYLRFADSGAGMIWLEAVAVEPEGRANPRQLMLTEKNLDAFKALADDIRETALRENGFAPVLILQAAHSGRYSKPNGKAEPLIACHNSILEQDGPLPDSRFVTDDHLKALEERYGETARLAGRAGFDGVDIKACHRYLVSELLSAYARPGEYGGSFKNRTRLYRNAVRSAQASVPAGVLVTSRLNLYDGLPYPYGWGVRENGGAQPDLDEAIRLVGILHRELGLNLLNFSIGNPYFNPHINRPFDLGPYVPDEHPLEGVARLCACIGEVRRSFPDLTAVSSGSSYLRQFSANLAAGMVESGSADLAGFGREAFAYPLFARDILEKGGMDAKKCCIACSKCTELMRAGSVTGCVVRDGETYLPLYRKSVLENSEDIAHRVSNA